MKYAVRHQTIYDYSEPVSLCHSTAHLRPRDTPHQICANVAIEIDPPPDAKSIGGDYFGNEVLHFSLQRPHRRLTVTAKSEVTVAAQQRTALLPDCAWEEVRDRVRVVTEERFVDPFQFVLDSSLVRVTDVMGEYTRSSFTPGRAIHEAAADLTARIHADFKYDAAATVVSTPLEEVWMNRRGVCQDFSHVQIACLRSIGLPARYVSGYLLTNPSPGQPRLIGADASHAWVSIYCLDRDWVDFDPTNNVIPGEKHVTVAWGRDFADVSPIRGVILGGGHHSVSVSVAVEPIG